jgi:general secretion pathway protein I
MQSSAPQRKTERPGSFLKMKLPGAAGFTLIEVLVALAVIAFALSAIIRATGVMTGNTAHLKEKTYAHWIAMNRVAELRVTKAWPSIGSTSDDVEMFGEDWRWMQEVNQMAISEHIRQVEISVIHREGGDEDFPLTKLTAFLLDPALISQTSLQSLISPPPTGNPDPNAPPDDSGNNPGEDSGIDGSEQPQ